MSAIRQGPWLIHDETVEFDNPWFSVHAYPVTRPDGNPGEYGVVRFKNRAIGVLPIDNEGCTWLVGQHRFPFNAYSWELPEGGGPKDEDPELAARRELAEETGMRAETLVPIGYWHLSNSVTDEEAYAYIATGLTAGEADPDPTEELQTRKIDFAGLLDLVFSGEITDAFTVLMVQSAYIQAQRGQLPEEISRLILTGGK